tara:strand:- start:294 stop:521 length:228 start_codon:yes stop_codon:yes gene_type:complete
LEGIIDLKAAIIEFEDASTNIRAKDITIAFSTLTVTAKAEQIPNICFVIGLLSINGSENIFLELLLICYFKKNAL